MLLTQQPRHTHTLDRHPSIVAYFLCCVDKHTPLATDSRRASAAAACNSCGRRARMAAAAAAPPPPPQPHAPQHHAALVHWDEQVAAYLRAALGPQPFAALQESLATPPLRTCLRANTLRCGSVRDVQQQLERLLLGSNGQRYPVRTHPQLPLALLLQGSGPHALDARGVTKEVVVSRMAGEAILRGAHVFVPGVLAATAGLQEGDAVLVTVHLSSGAVTRGTVLPALEGPGSQQQLQQGDRLAVGVGRACMCRATLFRQQHGVAVELQQRVYDVPSLHGQLQGLVMLQSLPSIVAACALRPAPGSRVLDMCAAPGGKATLLCQLMGGKGQVVALDRSHAKVDEIVALAAELGCSGCLSAHRLDAAKAVLDQPSTAGAGSGGSADGAGGGGSSRPDGGAAACGAAALSAKAQQRLARRLAAMAARSHTPTDATYRACGVVPAATCAGFPPDSFDAVLLDAPCTATGLRPRLQQRVSLPELLDTAAYQRRLLAVAVRLLRPGGCLVYSTCSISPAENEANVRHALDAHPCLRLVAASPRLGGPGLTGPADAAALTAVLADAAAQLGAGAGRAPAVRAALAEAREQAAGWLTPEQAAMVQRFQPGATRGGEALDTIGFFVAKFEKA